MCGIAGIYQFNNKSIDEGVLLKMRDTLTHRGPDDSGVYLSSDKTLGLAHRRLSIIDLSENAAQPMSNEDGSVRIIYNGEIYNFKELRPDLEKRGHVFKSNSDTEVIIHLYEEYKEKCLDYLRGMFAFAIWDEKEQKLFLARDRVGKKPLKYYMGSDFFVFASELKAILKHPEVKKEPDLEAIYHYLTFQYVPHPMTGFGGIKKLPPAHYMTVKLTEQHGSIRVIPSIEIKRYWRLDYSKKEDLSEEVWQERIMGELEEAVRLRMISDVPLGAFLSGGVDSSAIAGLMSKFSTKPIKTFSIGFEETDYNELPHARKISKLFKTEHNEFVVKSNAIDILPKLAYHYEEPYADSSAIPTFYLSELTRQYVTVALNGDGGDENFAGYDRYTYQKANIYYNKAPHIIRKMISSGLLHLSSFSKNKSLKKLARFSSMISEDPEKDYLKYICYFNENQKNKIMNEDFRAQVLNADYGIDLLKEKFNDSNVNNWLDRVLYADFNSYLPDDLMVKVDIASMAHSLEARSPLLDHKFLEFTAKIPASLKLKGRSKKYIFKKALENILPDEILHRKKKGFGMPLSSWFQGPLYEYTKSILLSEQATKRGLFKSSEVEKMIELHESGKNDYHNQLWVLLSLEHWFREYFD